MISSLLKDRFGSFAVSLGYIVLIVLLSHALGLVLPGKWFLPAINALLFFLLFLCQVSRGKYATAVKLALIWAAATIILQVILSAGWNSLLEEKVMRGAAYRDEIFNWVRTGEGPEGDIRLFLPIHVKHFLLFCALSVASGGLLGLGLGAVMLGYMNFYVGSLIASSGGAWQTILLGWPVWSMVRVAGYITAGTALGAILLDRTADKLEKRKKIIRYLIISLGLCVLDVLLKWALAGSWQGALNSGLKT